MKELWMRAGITLSVTDEEAEALLGSDDAAADKTICKILKEGRYCFNGNSYIPDTVVETFNRKYGTDFDIEEPEFELSIPAGPTLGM